MSADGVLRIETAPVFAPLLAPAPHKGAYGGRASGKGYFFADLLIDYAHARPKLFGVCIREVQRTLRDSSLRLIEERLDTHGLMGKGSGWRSLSDRTITPGGGVITYIGMTDQTAESIKSLQGVDVAWIDEAQTLSERSLALLKPTIRKENSETWYSWNPRKATDAVDKLFRGPSPPTGARCVRANWSDNPWLSAKSDQDRRDCLRDEPDQYSHIWDGEYVAALRGAYYSRELAVARQERRLTKVRRDPLLPVHAYCDIGGTGQASDAFAMWMAQIVGREVRVLDYYEAIGQPLAEHVAWLRDRSKGAARDYSDAVIVLPHDGRQHDRVYAVTYESELRRAGFRVDTEPNHGSGAALGRIQAVRRVLPQCWIDDEYCKAGLDALGWYHERRDENRAIGLGPEHDWSSHAADAFGLLALRADQLVHRQLAVEQRAHKAPSVVRRPYNDNTGWMG